MRLPGARNRQIRRLARAVEQGRGAVETVLGLPHVLAKPLIERHFGTQAHPSSEEFRETGREGAWHLPAAAPEFTVRVEAGGDGRITLGRIDGHGVAAGLLVFSEWDPEQPAPVWQIRLVEPRGEEAAALYERLVGEPPPEPDSASGSEPA
ncbi:MAG: hypothetical protein ACQERG_08770 [Pseudomonadota bacterium]